MRIKSNRVVLDGEVRPATIRIESGVVVEIGDDAADHDFGNHVVMPGLVDSHVHVNEPGRTTWEGFATATAAALAGGCTTIVDMPLNSVPPTVTSAALDEKRDAASSQISCDVAFWGGFVGPFEHLDPLVDAGVCGFKSFLVPSGVDEFPPIDVDRLGMGLEKMSRRAVPALIHAEDAASLVDPAGDTTLYVSYLESRPVSAEVKAVELVSALSITTAAQVHVLHVSSGEGADLIGGGPPGLTGETCPHYLTFAAEEIPAGATLFKCAPPIRERSQREALWDALGSGTLAMIVSDHSPAPPDLKATGDFATAWGGISSLELRLPITWTGARERGFGLVDLAEWLAAAPARLAGLDSKGRIAVGSDGDLVVWDPDARVEVDATRLRHRHRITPYDGMVFSGRVVTTILRGEVAFSDGGLVERHGRMLTRS